MANLRRVNNYKNYFDMIDDFFNTGLQSFHDVRNASFKVDIEDTDDKYIVSAELAGFDKDDISIDFDKGRLTIRAEKKEESETNEKNFVHKERRQESMSRTMYFENVEQDNMTAKLENGVLYIDVPKKKEQDTSKKIEIN